MKNSSNAPYTRFSTAKIQTIRKNTPRKIPPEKIQGASRCREGVLFVTPSLYVFVFPYMASFFLFLFTFL